MKRKRAKLQWFRFTEQQQFAKVEAAAPQEESPRGHIPENPFEGMSVEFAMLTPEMADQNESKTRWQRRRSKALIKKYARQQSGGQWVNYPALYILDKEGNPMDGGHRNGAVALSRVPIPIVLLKGADPHMLHGIDAGKPRNLQTNLEIDGEKASPELAGLLKFLQSYRTSGGLDFESFHFTIEDYYELLHEEPKVREVAVDWTIKPNIKVPKGLFAAVDYLVRTQAGENHYQFFADCARGEGVAEGDPAFAFREWVHNLGPKRNLKITAKIGYALIQCWDKFRRAQQVSRVRAPGECIEISPLEPALV
jgi:hypothetical protein